MPHRGGPQSEKTTTDNGVGSLGLIQTVSRPQPPGNQLLITDVRSVTGSGFTNVATGVIPADAILRGISFGCTGGLSASFGVSLTLHWPRTPAPVDGDNNAQNQVFPVRIGGAISDILWPTDFFVPVWIPLAMLLPSTPSKMNIRYNNNDTISHPVHLRILIDLPPLGA